MQQDTLILWGDRDRILGTKDALKFQSIISNHKLIWIKNSGHVPHLECAEITAQEMMAFASSDRLSKKRDV